MSSDNDSLTNPPSGGKLRQWEVLGMSRATWYRHGKPDKKPEPRLTQAKTAEALGLSIRTVQRDRKAATLKVVEEMHKARAEGREVDVAWVQERWRSHFAAALRKRETAAHRDMLLALDRMQFYAEMRGES
jgi:hypothetical protein